MVLVVEGSDTSPLASVVVPTKDRPDYLLVALRSLKSQHLHHLLYEVIVVDDGSRPGEVERTAQSALGDAIDWKVAQPDGQGGLNAARNAGIESASGDLVVFIDDDIEAPTSWLEQYVMAAQRYPGHEAFGGPIKAKLEGLRLRFCGREKPPISTLDRGQKDIETNRVWGGNLAVRRSAFDRVGLFDADHKSYGGDEEEWEQRLLDLGGKIMYVADAWFWHCRNRKDSTLYALASAAFRQGHGLREYDRKMDKAAPLTQELKVLAGCLGHAARYRCANGLIMAAHSAGRVADAARHR